MCKAIVPARFSVTSEELGAAWQNNKLHHVVEVDLNGVPLGRADAGIDMTFDFAQLVAHAAKSRRLGLARSLARVRCRTGALMAVRACRLARVDGATPALPSFAWWKQSTMDSRTHRS